MDLLSLFVIVVYIILFYSGVNVIYQKADGTLRNVLAGNDVWSIVGTVGPLFMSVPLLCQIVMEHAGVYNSFEKMRELAIVERYLIVMSLSMLPLSVIVLKVHKVDNIDDYFRFFYILVMLHEFTQLVFDVIDII